jgi:hypothetical protein
VRYVLGLSLVKTLASKHRCSCASLWSKHQEKIPTADGDIAAFAVRERREGKPDLVAYFGGLSLKRAPLVPLDDRVLEVFTRRTDLVRRLHAKRCELCGVAGAPLQNHHIRRLADLRRRGKEVPRWKEIMIQMQRKTLTVCKACHRSIHGGTYDGPTLS